MWLNFLEVHEIMIPWVQFNDNVKHQTFDRSVKYPFKIKTWVKIHVLTECLSGSKNTFNP